MRIFGLGSTTMGRIFGTGRKRGLTFVVVLCFALFNFGFVALERVTQPVGTSADCGSSCHEMSTAYQSWELSVHGANKRGLQVQCVACHLPSKENYLARIAAKAYAGGKDLYKHHVGSEYDIETNRKTVLDEMPSKRCLNCHEALLAKPGSQAARRAHMASLTWPDAPESRCVRCHEDAGHQRQSKLFSP